MIPGLAALRQGALEEIEGHHRHRIRQGSVRGLFAEPGPCTQLLTREEGRMADLRTTELDLYAFIDGRLADGRRREVATYLDAHPDAAERVAAYAQQRDVLALLGRCLAPEPSPPGWPGSRRRSSTRHVGDAEPGGRSRRPMPRSCREPRLGGFGTGGRAAPREQDVRLGRKRPSPARSPRGPSARTTHRPVARASSCLAHRARAAARRPRRPLGEGSAPGRAGVLGIPASALGRGPLGPVDSSFIPSEEP